MVTEDELARIQRRMVEAGITNVGTYMRKMALNDNNPSCRPCADQGAGVLTAAVCQQSQSGGRPCQHLRRAPQRRLLASNGTTKSSGTGCTMCSRSCLHPPFFRFCRFRAKLPRGLTVYKAYCRIITMI